MHDARRGTHTARRWSDGAGVEVDAIEGTRARCRAARGLSGSGARLPRRSEMSLTRASRRGFTLLELAVVVLIGGIVMGTAAVSFNASMRGVRLNQAAQVIATDLRVAVSLAARQQKPVRIECDCAARLLRVVDRATGTVLLTRNLKVERELGVTALTLVAADATSSATVFPSGITSSQLVVTIDDGTKSRTATLSVAGTVRTGN